jgi:hypothetical protein
MVYTSGVRSMWEKTTNNQTGTVALYILVEGQNE